MGHEYKTFDFEVKAFDYEGRTVEGYASVFGNMDLGHDVVEPGAFAKTLVERGNKVRFLWQHDQREPIGRPIEMREDDHGLFIKAIVSDTARGRDALALLRDNAISGLSIGYDAIPGGTEYSTGSDGESIRRLKELRLWEFSLVSMPMNESATVTALKEAPPAPTDAERKASAAELLRQAIALLEGIDETSAPAEDAGRDDTAPETEAGPDSDPPTSPDLERARLELLTQIESQMED